MFLRHRQRAVTAVAAPTFIIPKRLVYNWTMTVGQNNPYIGFVKNSYGKMVPNNVSELRIRETGPGALAFDVPNWLGEFMNFWAEGYSPSPVRLQWSNTFNQYRGFALDYYTFLAPRLGQEVKHQFAAVE